LSHLLTYDELLLEKIDFNKIIGKLKNPSKKIIILAASALLSIYSVSQAKRIVSEQELPEITKTLIINEIESTKIKDGDKFILSQDGWDFIRNEEKLRLTGYKIGDGMITIGYGHAEPIRTSKYKVGQKITKEEAEKLFIKDLNYFADGVRRIFKQWKKKNINVKITQGQFDAMVSMAYNMGLTNFRTSNFIQEVKKGNMENAAELIPRTNIKDKFPGLLKRRIKEKEMFSGA
jgi:lysozyme